MSKAGIQSFFVLFVQEALPLALSFSLCQRLPCLCFLFCEHTSLWEPQHPCCHRSLCWELSAICLLAHHSDISQMSLPKSGLLPHDDTHFYFLHSTFQCLINIFHLFIYFYVLYSLLLPFPTEKYKPPEKPCFSLFITVNPLLGERCTSWWSAFVK